MACHFVSCFGNSSVFKSITCSIKVFRNKCFPLFFQKLAGNQPSTSFHQMACLSIKTTLLVKYNQPMQISQNRSVKTTIIIPATSLGLLCWQSVGYHPFWKQVPPLCMELDCHWLDCSQNVAAHTPERNKTGGINPNTKQHLAWLLYSLIQHIIFITISKWLQRKRHPLCLLGKFEPGMFGLIHRK